MIYKNVWYSEPEMIEYCDRLNATIKRLKNGTNELNVIYNYLTEVKKNYESCLNACNADYLTTKHEMLNASEIYNKYMLEMLAEKLLNKATYYKIVLSFINGSLKLIEKEMNKI